MKTFVRNFAVISLVFVCSHLSLLAEGPAPLGDSSQLPFYSVENKIGVRIGAGIANSYLDLDFARYGYLQLEDDNYIDVYRDKFESNANVAASIGAKYALKNYFSVGLNLDYNALKLRKMYFYAGNNPSPELATEGVLIDDQKFGYIHALSMFAFMEFRLPLPNIGPGFVLAAVVPYAQIGVGATYLMQDMDSGVQVYSSVEDQEDIRRSGDKILDLDDEILFAFTAAGGLEFFFDGTSNVSLFFEGRWHYNVEGDFAFKPIVGSKFKGDLDISNLSWYMGVNLYFGGVEQKQS
jgi:hypothetical protein